MHIFRRIYLVCHSLTRVTFKLISVSLLPIHHIFWTAASSHAFVFILIILLYKFYFSYHSTVNYGDNDADRSSHFSAWSYTLSLVAMFCYIIIDSFIPGYCQSGGDQP